MRAGVLLCLALVASALPSCGQSLELVGSSGQDDVMVEVRASGSELPLLRAIWRQVPGGAASLSLQRTAETEEDQSLMLDRLAEAAIGAYLDARVHFTKQGVRSDLPADRLGHEVNGMLAAALEATGADVPFSGLSASTQRQLDRLTRIDWSQARFSVDSGESQDKYLAIYYYVRSQREELERQVRADLLPLSTVPVIGRNLGSPGTMVRINSTCGTVFDEENFLCALDLRLADSSDGFAMEPTLAVEDLRALSARAVAPEPAPAAQPKVRKRDRWLKGELDAIHQRIESMDQRKELWELRDRMDDLEDRITGLELEVQESRREPLIDNPAAMLSELTGRNITVRFERNSTMLLPEQQVLLNEVFEQLARSPLEKVLVTGYTDRSGDPEVNLRLSEARAKAVRNYLMQRGISPDRLLVNYYGDSRSIGRDPGERRVEVEWIR